jgi:hypothetical protein
LTRSDEKWSASPRAPRCRSPGDALQRPPAPGVDQDRRATRTRPAAQQKVTVALLARQPRTPS